MPQRDRSYRPAMVEEDHGTLAQRIAGNANGKDILLVDLQDLGFRQTNEWVPAARHDRWRDTTGEAPLYRGDREGPVPDALFQFPSACLDTSLQSDRPDVRPQPNHA